MALEQGVSAAIFPIPPGAQGIGPGEPSIPEATLLQPTEGPPQIAPLTSHLSILNSTQHKAISFFFYSFLYFFFLSFIF